jgi:hypothetical protein
MRRNAPAMKPLELSTSSSLHHRLTRGTCRLSGAIAGAIPARVAGRCRQSKDTVSQMCMMIDLARCLTPAAQRTGPKSFGAHTTTRMKHSIR